MSMIDMSGQPDSDEDLQDAIDCMATVMTKHATDIPLLTVHAGIIHRCLKELQVMRGLLKQAKEAREAKEKEVSHDG